MLPWVYEFPNSNIVPLGGTKSFMTCHMKSASFSATNQLVALFDGIASNYKKFKHSKNVSCYTEPRYSFIPNSIQKLEIFQTKRQSQIKSYL